MAGQAPWMAMERAGPVHGLMSNGRFPLPRCRHSPRRYLDGNQITAIATGLFDNMPGLVTM